LFIIICFEKHCTWPLVILGSGNCLCLVSQIVIPSKGVSYQLTIITLKENDDSLLQKCFLKTSIILHVISVLFHPQPNDTGQLNYIVSSLHFDRIHFRFDICSFICQGKWTRRQQRDRFGLPSQAATCYSLTNHSKCKHFCLVHCQKIQQVNLPS